MSRGFPRARPYLLARRLRAHRQTLGAGFQQLTERGLLRVDDPFVAAGHFAGLLLWIPMNRVMFGGEDSVSDAQLERAADAGVRAFLAAYGGVERNAVH